MKNVKKFVAGLMAAAMLFVSGVGVMAAPSKQEVQSLFPYYIVNRDGEWIMDARYFEELKEKHPEIADMLEKASKGELTAADFADCMEAWLEKADISEEAKERTRAAIQKIRDENLEFVTKFFDLKPVGDVKKNEDGMYEPTIIVSQLTKGLENVNLLHYSLVRDGFEIIVPNSVDLDKKTIAFEVQDLSPMVVLADKDSIKKAEADGTSPKTEGTSYTWLIWMGAAGMLLAAGSTVIYRKKKCR